MNKWSSLEPNAKFLEVLEYSGNHDILSTQNEKRAWSEKFADGTAFMIAESFKTFASLTSSSIKNKEIRPDPNGGRTEPLTPLSTSTKKRIDVTVVDSLLGLEIGVSLKSLNFPDGSNGNFDKNITGRLYELGDEMRLVHEHLPQSFMVGVIFLPLEATIDKPSVSSFANVVLKLKNRTGRLDPSLAVHNSRCDLSFVGLYTRAPNRLALPPGLLRFYSTDEPPPKSGRPKVEKSFSAGSMVEKIIQTATHTGGIEWGEPECQ